jgi:hypothetical protein
MVVACVVVPVTARSERFPAGSIYVDTPVEMSALRVKSVFGVGLVFVATVSHFPDDFVVNEII